MDIRSGQPFSAGGVRDWDWKVLGSFRFAMDCVVSGFRFLQEADRSYVHTKFLLGPAYVHGCNVNDGEARGLL